MEQARRVRSAIVDGIFYPESASDLSALVEETFSPCTDPPGSAVAVVSPHAGYEYCASQMACAFNAARNRDISTVVVIAPVHREPVDAVLVSESDAFRTPLGEAPVDRASIQEMERCSTRVYADDIPHLEEHAIEVQIPYIQTLFPQAAIVPVLLGRVTLTNAGILAKALGTVFGDRVDTTLFVLSSNLSTHTGEAEAEAAVSRLITLLQKRDAEELVAAYGRREVTACGAGCMAAMLKSGIRLSSVRMVSRGSPGGPTKGYNRIIHYGAIAFE
jgi:AmmeMemoRadiSam system protein B